VFSVDYQFSNSRARDDFERSKEPIPLRTVKHSHFGGTHALLLMVAMYLMALIGGVGVLAFLTSNDSARTELAGSVPTNESSHASD
jgi:hypothetical protein